MFLAPEWLQGGLLIGELKWHADGHVHMFRNHRLNVEVGWRVSMWYANGAHLSAIWGKTALVQWIRCEPLDEHLIVFPHIARKLNVFLFLHDEDTHDITSIHCCWNNIKSVIWTNTDIRLTVKITAYNVANLSQGNLLRMVKWMRWHCSLDTGGEIRTLTVWNQARYLSVTEDPIVLSLCEWVGKKHCFVSLKRECQSGGRIRDLRPAKQANITTAPGPPPHSVKIDK